MDDSRYFCGFMEADVAWVAWLGQGVGGGGGSGDPGKFLLGNIRRWRTPASPTVPPVGPPIVGTVFAPIK